MGKDSKINFLLVSYPTVLTKIGYMAVIYHLCKLDTYPYLHVCKSSANR